MTNFFCTTCGSKNILFDAYVQWDSKRSSYEIANIFDHTFCSKCEGECQVEGKEI